MTPPSGTANLVLAAVLLVTLILRPKGITAGREISWPGDWTMPRFLRRRRAESAEPAAKPDAVAETPASPAE